MSEEEKRIMTTFGSVLPELSNMDKEKLLAFGAGMAFKALQTKKT